jgi:2-polyprenyl-6-methoxyphenol hydroxylase-like FAD-dependent oxidoreductase
MSMSGLSGRRVLVSGGGLAGPAVACLLARAGGEVTVVEIADRVRPGGQAVDIRGAGRTVLRRMGLLDRVRAVSLHQRGIADVDARGRRRREMTVDAFAGEGITARSRFSVATWRRSSSRRVSRPASPTCSRRASALSSTARTGCG